MEFQIYNVELWNINRDSNKNLFNIQYVHRLLEKNIFISFSYSIYEAKETTC